MPELPEVETVRRGLAPCLEGGRIEHVTLNRPDLRFALPQDLGARLNGRVIEAVTRRAKYLLMRLSDGSSLLSHLGMTGVWRFAEVDLAEPGRYHGVPGGHEHVVITIRHPQHGRLHLIYADPRRFGFIDLIAADEDNRFLAGLGPEPLGNAFSADALAAGLSQRRTPIKSALLNQRLVAGLGNIYVCEALHRAHILPTTPAHRLVRADGRPKQALVLLVEAVRAVLIEAIEAGGSTLRDFRAADGKSGYFQHRFAVYDREGQRCPTPMCQGIIVRILQAGRSSFYCPVCQKPVR